MTGCPRTDPGRGRRTPTPSVAERARAHVTALLGAGNVRHLALLDRDVAVRVDLAHLLDGPLFDQLRGRRVGVGRASNGPRDLPRHRQRPALQPKVILTVIPVVETE